MQLFNQRIKELNHIAGEGVAVIKVVDGTSRLKTPEKLVLSVYSNGIILQNGQLRPHNDPSVKLFMRDILDGYFPYELKDLYPDGVPFEVRDCHDEEYQGWKRAKYIPFGGQGMSLIDSSTENVNDKIYEPEPNKPMTEATPKDSDKRHSISQPPHNPEPPSKSTSQHSTRRRTLTPKSVSTASKSQISAESLPEKPPTIHAAFNTGEILRIYSSPTILMKPVYLTTSNPSETKLEIQTSTSNMQNTIQLKITSFCNFEFGTTTLILTLPQSWTVSQCLSALNSYLSMGGIIEWKLVVFLGMSNQNTLYSTQTFTSNSISDPPRDLALSVSIKEWGMRVASHLVNFK
ncbi:hypothetical protein BCR33DRAFT_740476 [Rhizoclosmatium globosum]|uniref:UBX domain-containing protein 11 n=1 Tax=Rhizoclosmatium globosum TaxID=329046 RepID=A0A1Y2BZR4_9FUNG|nr:hypothetical protein BCR33DRAFT_740476 [Rhizoclosmatium globosum]|eukprot:ORY40216.1 hypothetical protein BCR33DRAFT_740476 [Rhizoclosmatium globosum]